MHVANVAGLASERLLLPLCQRRSVEEERGSERRVWGVAGLREGWERGGSTEGLRKGEGMQGRELVKAKKREKGQDIE